MEYSSLLDSDLPIPESMVQGIHRAITQIAAGGTMLAGAQRVEVANATRDAWAGQTMAGGESTATSTASKMATHAHDLSGSDVAAFDDPATYVEILGIVARTAAIDTTTRGIGVSDVALPAGDNEAPSGGIDPAARQRSALVPTVGAAGPVSALSLLPSEAAAQEDLAGSLYLSYAEMGQVAIHKGLPRWQLELVAARTSLINHCFY